MNAMALQLLAGVIVLVAVLGPAFIGGWFLIRRKRQARQQRRSPLTTDLLRAPGHALRDQLEDARINAAMDLVLLTAMPGLLMSMLYVTSLLLDRPQSVGVLVVVFLALMAFSWRQIRSLLRRSEEMDQWRLGLDAEVAAGQELDQLMRQGAVVFHDLPGEMFNIDHVVIAPQGVFAVETKGYRKPNRDGGADDAKVYYDGKVLKFPDWSSEKPLRQAQRQARWLAQWLTRATGEPTEVTPALALPGWFIERQGRGPVAVFGRTELERHLLKTRDARPLSAEQMQRVVHQVEQRCRDVKPNYRAETDDE